MHSAQSYVTIETRFNFVCNCRAIGIFAQHRYQLRASCSTGHDQTRFEQLREPRLRVGRRLGF